MDATTARAVSNPTKVLVPPDGGWGWLIVLGASIVNMFNQSLISVFGLLFGEHLKSLGEATVGAALVMNLCSLVQNLSGLVIGPALKYYSSRQVAICGSALTGLGLILSAFSTQLWHVTLTYSLFVGLGLGLINPSSFMAVNAYFSKRRGRAVGFALAGTGVGQMIMPHLVRILLDEYEFRGAALILGALSLNGIAGACLFQPVKWHMKGAAAIDETKRLLDPKVIRQSPEQPLAVLHSNLRMQENAPTISLPRRILQNVSNALDLDLLKRPRFLLIVFGISLTYTATTQFSLIFPYFLQDSVGLSRQDTSLCMSVLAGADLVSRLTLPSLTDRYECPARIIFLSGAVCLAAFRSGIAESNDRVILLVLSAFYGYARATTVVNANLTISESCKKHKLAGALGLNMLVKGIIVISLGQLLGWVRDYTASYVFTLHAQNILLALVIALWLPDMLYRSAKKCQCAQSQNEDEEKM